MTDGPKYTREQRVQMMIEEMTPLPVHVGPLPEKADESPLLVSIRKARGGNDPPGFPIAFDCGGV